MAYRDADTRVRCPYCRAGIGSYCRTFGYRRAEKPHRARVHAADEVIGEAAGQPDG